MALAVSGGGDSIALTAVLCEARIIVPARAVVAHFDHAWRGEAAAARDRAVVDAVCERYGLALVTGRWQTPRRSEAAARDARYAFLLDVAGAHNATVVVTGHTEDDQLETLMLNMDRGAGTYGLAGIWPERPFPRRRAAAAGLRLARPLLCVAREETRAYCATRGLASVDDETNDDPAFARNRIRAMLADGEATLEARGLLLQLAVTTRASIRTLEATIASAAPCSSAEGGRALAFDRDALRAVPEELRIYAWHPALQRLLGDARDFGRGHFETLARVPAARTGTTFELPRGVIVTIEAARVLLSIGPLEEPALEPAWERLLPFAGRAGAWEILVTATGEAPSPAEEGWHASEVAVDGAAVLRAWRPSDRVALAGGRGHRKLQDAYVDAKVPQRQRAGAPVLARGADVLWTPLLGSQPAPAGSGGERWCVRWRPCERRDDTAR